MRWLTTMSASKVVMLAMLWPLGFVLGVPLLARLFELWLAWQDGGRLVHLTFFIEPGSWPAIVAFLIVPPLLLLGAWWASRRR